MLKFERKQKNSAKQLSFNKKYIKKKKNLRPDDKSFSHANI